MKSLADHFADIQNEYLDYFDREGFKDLAKENVQAMRAIVASPMSAREAMIMTALDAKVCERINNLVEKFSDETIRAMANKVRQAIG